MWQMLSIGDSEQSMFNSWKLLVMLFQNKKQKQRKNGGGSMGIIQVWAS